MSDSGKGLGQVTGFGWSGVAGAAVLATALAGGVLGCHGSQQGQAQIVNANDNGPDPADANMAPVQASEAAAAGQGLSEGPAGGPARTNAGYQTSSSGPATARYQQGQGAVNESQQAAQGYPQGQQAPAPIERQTPEQEGFPAQDQGYAADQGQSSGDQGDDAQALSDGLAADAVAEQAPQPPPPLPEYDQPPAPADDYLWTPGYWSYAPAGYYWVPGVWCAAPYVGALWTPGWWGAYGHGWGYHRGYWGRYVGFYGGVAYGFGYYGTGYHGGYWNGNHFAYNRAVTNVNIVNVHNVYNRTVIVNNVRINNSVTNRYVNNVAINNRVSYNGGRGGIQARPMPAEVAAFRTQRTPPMSAQMQNQRAAAANRAQFFGQNQGRPQIAAAARPVTADRVAVPPAVPINRPGAVGTRPGAVGTQPGLAGTRPGAAVTRPEAVTTRPGFAGAPAQGQAGFRPGQAGVQPGGTGGGLQQRGGLGIDSRRQAQMPAERVQAPQALAHPAQGAVPVAGPADQRGLVPGQGPRTPEAQRTTPAPQTPSRVARDSRQQGIIGQQQQRVQPVRQMPSAPVTDGNAAAQRYSQQAQQERFGGQPQARPQGSAPEQREFDGSQRAQPAPQPQRPAPQPQRPAPQPQRPAPQPQRAAPAPARPAPAPAERSGGDHR